MKLRITCILLLVSAGLGAQNSKWTFGVESGINVARIDDVGKDYVISSSSFSSPVVAPGFSPTIGFISQYKLTKKLAIQTGLNFSPVKTCWTYHWTLGEAMLIETQFRTRLNYLNIPFILNYSVHNGEKVGFVVGLGASVGYSLQSRVNRTDNIVANPIYPATDLTPGPTCNITSHTDVLLVNPTLQSAVDFKLKKSKTIRVVLACALSINQPVRRGTPFELSNPYFTFSENRLQVLPFISVQVAGA